jgi:RNA polymerase sigma factor (sigma-70 family)
MGFAPRTEHLATRAAEGDRAALDDLLGLIQPEVLRYCGRFLYCREDAEEAAQDVLLQVARNITGFAGRSRFTTWLYTVIANSSRRTYRDLVRRSNERPIAPTDVFRDPRTTSVIAGSRLDLLDAIDKLERRHPQLVTPFVFRQVLEMEYAEIVERTGVPLGTVKSRLHESRRLVRSWLAVDSGV